MNISKCGAFPYFAFINFFLPFIFQLWENKLLQSKAVEGFYTEEQTALQAAQQQQQQQVQPVQQVAQPTQAQQVILPPQPQQQG